MDKRESNRNTLKSNDAAILVFMIPHWLRFIGEGKLCVTIINIYFIHFSFFLRVWIYHWEKGLILPGGEP